MSNIHTYLEVSSIHGLRYLNGKNGRHLPRLIWTLCIAGSFTAAFSFIYLNIRNWQNSPAVVTNVDIIDVREKVELPSIHICPVSGSWGFFARRFLNKYSDQLSNDDQMAINRGVVNSLIMLSKNGRYRVDRNDYKVLINWCQEDEANGRTDGCQLSAILLEYALTNKGSELILEYLVKVVMKETSLSIQSMKDHLILETEVNITTLSRYPESVIEYSRTLGLLTFLFDAIIYDPQKDVTLMKLRPLSDFNTTYPFPPPVTEVKLGAFLINFANVVTVSNGLNRLTTALLINILGMEGDDYDRLRYLLYLYSPNYFGWTYGWKQIKIACDFVKNDDLETVCLQSGQTCPFCQVPTHFSDEKLKELVFMLLDDLSPDPNLNPLPILEPCTDKENVDQGNEGNQTNCWTKTLTEFGICYTPSPFGIDDPNTNGKITAIDETGRLFSYQITTKFLPSFGNNFDSDVYEVIVFPPRNLGTGRMASNIFKQKITMDRSRTLNFQVERVTEVTESFKSMSLSSRKCYLKDERHLQYFQHYTEANCLLECAWINAAKTCDCIPWYLNQVLPEYKLCNIFSIEHCFDTLVRKRFNSKHHKSDEAQSCYSQCLPDCEFVELKVDIKDSLQSEVNFNFLQNVEDKVYESVPLKLKEFSKGVGIQDSGMQYFIQLRMKIEDMMAMRILKTASMTTVDMVSNIGGTLGLFCGFSILSVVEIFFWIGKCLFKEKNEKTLGIGRSKFQKDKFLF